MKNHPTFPFISWEPTPAEISDYAYHLYREGNSEAGHDVENWLEAKACLQQNIPAHHSRTRLHRQIKGPDDAELQAVA